MKARLILSVSGNGELSVSLQGRGRAMQELLRGYETSIAYFLPTMKRKVTSALMRDQGRKDENTNPDSN